MTPTINYRPADNAAYIRFSSAKVLESAEVSPDVVSIMMRTATSSGLNCLTRDHNYQPMC
jgi:hypothetical protein